MRPELKWTISYLAAVSVVFGAAYFGMDLREAGLALLMMVLDLPGSIVVLPLSEKAAAAAGTGAGSPSHIWTTQLVVMVINGTLVYFARRALGPPVPRPP